MEAASGGSKRAKWVAAMLAATATLALGALGASATVIEQGRFSGTDSFSFDDCGFWLDVESTFQGHGLFRVDKGGQAFLSKTTFRFRDVLTNRATGKSFVVRGHGLFHEIKATQISGTVYEFQAVEAGQPFVIEDSAGNVIVRDRGVIRHTAIFDTLGDGMPGGILVGEPSAIVHGPHPGFAEDFPFCEIAAQLTAA